MRELLKRLLKLSRAGAGAPRRGPVEVGWLVDYAEARFVFDAPRALHRRERPDPQHSKAVGRCPAVADLDARLFEVPCPLDLRLRLQRPEAAQPVVINVDGPSGAVTAEKLRKLLFLLPRERWRDPRYPVLQVAAPWRFIADEPVWMSQMPAFFDQPDPMLPGVLIGGRFPIHIWPRILMWAFEWRDTDSDLVLRRGQPWFYLQFESEKPERSIRLVEAQMTEALREYCQGLDSVTNYVNQTYSLFKVAKARRPKKLLLPKG